MPRKPECSSPELTKPKESLSLSRFFVRVRNLIRRATLQPGKRSVVDDFRDRPFSKAVVLLGPPRGGTTIVSRCIGQHSSVQSVIEPFQRRRAVNYSQTEPASLSADFGLRPDPGGCLLVKETFTRYENVDNALKVLEKLVSEGTTTTLVYVCRSPIAGFNSQVQASAEQWAIQNTFSPSTESLKGYLHSTIRNSLSTLFEPLYCRRMLIFYEDFCAQPELEMRRVMTLLDMPYESAQLALNKPSKVTGGDPGAKLRKQIETVDDQHAVQMLPEKLLQSRLGASAMELHDAVQRLASQHTLQEDAILQLRESMQAISERHFPALHRRFIKLINEQGEGI